MSLVLLRDLEKIQIEAQKSHFGYKATPSQIKMWFLIWLLICFNFFITSYVPCMHNSINFHGFDVQLLYIDFQDSAQGLVPLSYVISDPPLSSPFLTFPLLISDLL